MQTYTHIIISAILAKTIVAKQSTGGPGNDSHADASEQTDNSVPAMQTKSFLLGSVAPDIPLILLTVVFLARDLITGSVGGADSSLDNLFRHLFYHDPWVKTAHNLFHAPLLILLYGAIGYWAWRRGKRWGPAVFWFAVACMIHTLIDIPLHYDDGPLVFFPFDWETRFYSPISYWDPRRYGIQFAIMEHIVVLGMLVYLVVDWRRRRTQSRLETAG